MLRQVVAAASKRYIAERVRLITAKACSILFKMDRNATYQHKLTNSRWQFSSDWCWDYLTQMKTKHFTHCCCYCNDYNYYVFVILSCLDQSVLLIDTAENSSYCCMLLLLLLLLLLKMSMLPWVGAKRKKQ